MVHMPSKVDGKPPEKPNCYSDGSLKNPRYQKWSLGGFGLWWPGGDISNQPLGKTEAEFTVNTDNKDGIRMWGALPGGKTSSTRTELAAGLVAATAPIPVHQATDSMSYCRMANKITNGQKVKRRKPWAMTKNGDL